MYPMNTSEQYAVTIMLLFSVSYKQATRNSLLAPAARTHIQSSIEDHLVVVRRGA